MEVTGEFIVTLVVTVGAIAGLLWRLETRISGVERRLGERISEVSDRVSRIEGLLEGYFLQARGSDDKG